MKLKLITLTVIVPFLIVLLVSFNVQAQSSKVDVTRGGGANDETEFVVRNVLVQKGAPAVEVGKSVPKPSPSIEMVAGRTLWIVNLDSGRVVGCKLLRTGTVGKRKVRCGGRLTRGLRIF